MLGRWLSDYGGNTLCRGQYLAGRNLLILCLVILEIFTWLEEPCVKKRIYSNSAYVLLTCIFPGVHYGGHPVISTLQVNYQQLGWTLHRHTDFCFFLPQTIVILLMSF